MSEIRQRWRLIFARDEEARYLSHLDAVHLWERAFRRGEIPLATSEGFNPRPKLVFAAPLQLGMLAERDLADLFLAERLTSPEMRRRLAAGMPSGYRVVDLHDVWIGAPALAPQLAAADYRVTLFNVKEADLAAAATKLMTAEELPRQRHREKRTISYDLRPLLLEIQVRAPDPALIAEYGAGPAGAGVDAADLWLRLRHSQDGGSGRVEEVVAALAGELGMATRLPSGPGTTPEPDAGLEDATAMPLLEAVGAVRERLWLSEELEPAETRLGPSSSSRVGV
ncbi:MAG TPA: TIGR03936 family radical SAM-associated protein [Candidatus Limnocylindrales bacterium]